MNRITLCLLLSMVFITAASQKVYFVYLQTETDQPFVVKMNGKLHSSTGSGYLILSKLHDSSYNFSVGFPQNRWPEQHFSIAVNKKDHGYLLKNFGDKGWGLFDLLTMGVQMAVDVNPQGHNVVKTEKKEVSAFTEILSRAADDSSLKEKPVQQKVEEKKVENTTPEPQKKEEVKMVTTDTAVMKKEEPKVGVREQPVEKKEETTIIPVETYKPSVVTKRSESSTTEGVGLVFTDQFANGASDTIRILIPNPKLVVNLIKEEPKEEKKFLDITTDTTTKIKYPPTVSKPVSNEVTENKPAVQNSCKEVAVESDFFKLRKKMAAESTDDGMLTEARKYFKTKCFTVAQVKNLSTMFLSDAGKYQFFDAAYLYISDAGNFSSLHSELKEEYYINRFKAMIRN